MKKAMMFLLTGTLLFCLAACSASINNEASCNKWKTSVAKCGTIDVSASINCDVYKNVTTCDISAYFDCLTTNYKCTNDIPDTAGWGTCAVKATCS